ncbi:hypothetical protein D3H65_04620 [Paraflavitalea soli]|uniref:Uncharacterized protein n=1 Tax=Paraflavitalea soli TaxID=2315862 RepID=A0A3B7MP18_9BACT|nr:hypothetical protein [Paraflavitalea soli]AXY73305.1 hypothetical protein D3H65_04620 [Paraflavitalea soli]
MTEAEMLEILKQNSTGQWIDWIDDILHFDIAYPVSRITPHGDPLVDIIFLLTKNNLSRHRYEKALLETFRKLSDALHPATLHLERVLDVVTETKPHESSELLRELFLDRRADNLILPNGHSLKGKLLLAVVKTIQREDAVEIISYCKVVLDDMLMSDAAFMANFLRLVVSHRKMDDYFPEVTNILLHSNIRRRSAEDPDQYLITLQDSLEEVQYDHPSGYYTAFYHWITRDFHRLKGLESFQCLVNVLYENIEVLFDTSTPAMARHPEIGHIMALREFIILWSDPAPQKPITARSIHHTVSFFLDHNGPSVMRESMRKNAIYLTDELFINQRTLMDRHHPPEIIDNDDIMEFLEKVFQGFLRRDHEPRPAYDEIHGDEIALDAFKRQTYAQNAADFMQLRAQPFGD